MFFSTTAACNHLFFSPPILLVTFLWWVCLVSWGLTFGLNHGFAEADALEERERKIAQDKAAVKASSLPQSDSKLESFRPCVGKYF